MDENIGLLCQETKLDDVLLNKELEDSITRFSLASPSAHVRESISSVDACQDPIDAHESANSDHPRKQSLTNTLTRIGDELLNGHNIETCSRRLSFKRALQFSQTPEKSKMNKDQSSTGLIPRNLLVDLTDPCDVENLPPQLKQSDSKVSNSAPTTCEANPQDHVFSIHTRNRLQFQRSRSMFELGSLQGCHDIQGGAIEKEGSAPRSNHARFPKSENSEHPDLYYISAQTAVEILEGKHESTHQRCIFIDCRYPFEYSGGSIRGAINTPTPEQAVNFLFEDGKRRFDETALVFFCEFSSQRGPCALRHVRATDRTINALSYPMLLYPNMYLLSGGYRSFFHHSQSHCEPQHYVAMKDPRFASDLRDWTRERRLGKRTRSYHGHVVGPQRQPDRPTEAVE
eukprot:TRINITY_DN3619_c0_g1_i1.p1 TRINITY_DN3619_c0_g1~~TRINITY_DN3619_c0_g1_i1.p1  ORF type:complete len:400 (-),score=77.51 TRINITY_DN3619_c0_g1_i1:156-1355(-)